MHSQLVVLGGGPGGYAAAFMAADLGMEVTLVERESRLGGVCLLRGCIPSKALLHVSKVIDEARHLGEWGVNYESPAIDIDAMRARKEKVIRTLTGGLKQLAKKRKVNVIQARGYFEGSTTLRLEPVDGALLDDDRLTFDHCVLAVGSSPTKLRAFDIGSDRVMDSTGALELADIPESLLVIGGGYIGLEMGTVYAQLGSAVSVIELTDSLLPGVDADLVKPLHARTSKLFKAIRLGTKVESLRAVGNEIEVEITGPDGQEKTNFSRVLVAVGRRPNSQDIGLENTKVELTAQGFAVVDDRQRTADEHILAIGDIAGEPMLAHKAAHEGKIAVEALHGGPAAFDKLAIPAVVFTDPEIAWAGLTETEAKRDKIKVEVGRYPWAASGRAQALGITDGLTKMLIDPATERILGAGFVGTGAGELVAEAVVAIEMGCTARDVAESIHPHPTLSETFAFAAESYLGIATEIYRPKRKRQKA